MNFTITPLLPSELPAFFHVFEEILTHEFNGYSKNIVRYLLDKIYSQNNYEYWLQNKLKMILTAKNTDGKIVGFAVIDEPYGGVSLCRWLGVLHDWQRKGIGTMLIKEWLKLATFQQCHKAELAAMPNAKTFYEKVGLGLEGLRKLSYFGTDQYVFGKILGGINEASIIR